MELSDLKSDWQKAGGTPKGEPELLLMTKVSGHPSLKRIRIKFIIETIALAIISIVYYDWFDGDKKPLYANALLIGGIILYLLNDIIGYIALVKPIRGKNIRRSIENFAGKIRRLSILSLLVSVTYSLSFILFFTSSVTLTSEKYLILAGMIITLIVATYISYRMWKQWISNLKNQIKEFDRAE